MMHINKMFGSAGENQDPLSWDLRVQIALDVARGLEYLHYGGCFVLFAKLVEPTPVLIQLHLN
jgi:hypothetical protein